MNNYGLMLNLYGLKSLITHMVEEVISHLAKKLWWCAGEDSLDVFEAFTMEYGQNKDKRLNFHVDDAEITLNYCLGTKFEGGVVKFKGIRCREHT